MVAIGIAIGLLVVVVGAINLILRRARPSHAARRRLDAHIREVERRLATASIGDDRLVTDQVAQIRKRWIEDQMTSTLVEAVDIPGIGPSLHQTLRDHGISSLHDLGRFNHMKMPGIGDKKRRQLLLGHRRAVQQIVARAEAMDHAALDAYTKGRLGEVVKNHEADELARHREVEDLRIRLGELRRRRALIDT